MHVLIIMYILNLQSYDPNKKSWNIYFPFFNHFKLWNFIISNKFQFFFSREIVNSTIANCD